MGRMLEMLELRPNCELCDCDLPPESPAARICSYECTFCVSCVDAVLQGVCPNCGGNLVPRPIRPRKAWREGVSRVDDPPSTKRRQCKYSREQLAAFAELLREIDPGDR
jgi:hypothetical protein